MITPNFFNFKYIQKPSDFHSSFTIRSVSFTIRREFGEFFLNIFTHEKTFMKNFNLHTLFLILFLIGILLLGLGGFVNFGSGYRSSIENINSNFLLIAIPFILPYFIYSVKERFFKKTEKEIFVEHSKQNIETFFEGEKLDLIFKTSIVSMNEIEGEPSAFSGLMDDLMINRIQLSETHSDFYTIAKVKYRIDGQNYFKEILFPFTLKNTEIFLKMNPSTHLYFQKENPENAKVDLRFLNDYL